MELFAVFLKEEVNGMKHKCKTCCKKGDDGVHG